MRVKEYLAGIDVGSTNIKCAVYDTEGHAAAVAVHPTAGAYLNKPELPGRFFEPEVLWMLVAKTGAEAFSALDGPYVLKGIAVASVGCDCIFLDGQDRPVLISPGRESVENTFEYWKERLGAKNHFEETGYPLDVTNTEFYIAACAQSDRGGFERIRKLMSVADYISYRLTGVFSREYSTAASMGLMNVHTHKWRGDFLDAVGLSETVLGSPVYGGEYIGSVAERAAEAMNIPEGTPVYTGGHDYLCSALACSAGPGSMLDVGGTVEVVSVFTDLPETRLYDENNRFIIDHGVVPDRYSLMMEAPGMGCVEWFRRNAIKTGGFEKNAVPGGGRGTGGSMPLFMPHVLESIISGNSRDIKKAFLFADEKTDDTSLHCAILEGLSFQCRQMTETLQKACPGNTRILYAGGGAVRKDWVQSRADVIGQPVFVPAVTESTALGAALLAGVGSRVYGSYSEAASVSSGLGGYTSAPDPENAQIYEEIYKATYLPALKAFRHSENPADGIKNGGEI